MKFHVQVRDIGSDQDNGIAMLSFANLLDLLPCQLKDWNDSQERERERMRNLWYLKAETICYKVAETETQIKFNTILVYCSAN